MIVFITIVRKELSELYLSLSDLIFLFTQILFILL